MEVRYVVMPLCCVGNSRQARAAGEHLLQDHRDGSVQTGATSQGVGQRSAHRRALTDPDAAHFEYDVLVVVRRSTRAQSLSPRSRAATSTA